MTPIIGNNFATTKPVPINVSRLVSGRLLIQSNSGGGKSWAIRRLLEQTHGIIPQIVIDVEDEFHTLRDKYDYILAGKDADCVVETRSAPLLARRLLQLGVSTIINISDLEQWNRIQFVKLFLESLISAPRNLWHECMIVLDEAHMFASQHTKTESTGAVIDLMTRGRKRGFAGVLATQRIAKLHKDAVAEANSKLIGRCSLDVDMKRSADELGFASREDVNALRTLEPGTFYCFGPAFTDRVTLIRVGDVHTRHPEPGDRSAPLPPPREKVKKVLAQLADLPKEAANEAKTVDDLKREIAMLKRGSTATSKATTVKVEKVIERVPVPMDQKTVKMMMDSIEMISKMSSRTQSLFKELVLASQKKTNNVATMTKALKLEKKVAPSPELMKAFDTLIPRPAVDGSNKGGSLRIMVALAQRPDGLSYKQIGVRAGISSKSGTFSTYISRLRSCGYIQGEKDCLRITESGLSSLGTYNPLPKGQKLYEYWANKFGSSGQGRLLQILYNVYPEKLSTQDLAEKAGMAVSGTLSTYISRLRSLELVEGRGSELQASPELFNEE